MKYLVQKFNGKNVPATPSCRYPDTRTIIHIYHRGNTEIYPVFSPALTIVVVISSQEVPINRDHKMSYRSSLTST